MVSTLMLLLGGRVKTFQKFCLIFLGSLLSRSCKHLPVSSVGQLRSAVLPHVTLPRRWVGASVPPVIGCRGHTRLTEFQPAPGRVCRTKVHSPVWVALLNAHCQQLTEHWPVRLGCHSPRTALFPFLVGNNQYLVHLGKQTPCVEVRLQVHGSESAGGLVPTVSFRKSGRRSKNEHFWQVPRWCPCSWYHIHSRGTTLWEPPPCTRAAAARSIDRRPPGAC